MAETHLVKTVIFKTLNGGGYVAKYGENREAEGRPLRNWRKQGGTGRNREKLGETGGNREEQGGGGCGQV